MSTRRSSRSAYKSLVELEKRAKEAEAAAAGPLWGQDAFAEDDDDDDGSFDAERLSDDGEVRLSKFHEPCACSRFRCAPAAHAYALTIFRFRYPDHTDLTVSDATCLFCALYGT